jgi:hypothetical protein
MKFSLWSLISVIAVCTAILFSGGIYEITLLDEEKYAYSRVVNYMQTNKLTGESRYCLLNTSTNTKVGPAGSDRCVPIDNEFYEDRDK